MTDYIDFYTESELDPLFNNILEVEGFCKVKELSRQLRTFFNYKAEAIQLRFQTSVQTNHFSNNSWTYNTLYAQKQQIKSLSYDFISLLKSINRDDTNLEQEIYFLHLDKKSITFSKLSQITKQIFDLIHYFSENGIHNHPKFLNFIVVLTKEICFVKKCLNEEFYEFYDELEKNYVNLAKELKTLLKVPSVKNLSIMKRREERLSI